MAQFTEGGRIKEWVKSSEWGHMGWYSLEGNIGSHPPHLSHPNFRRRKMIGGGEGEWEEVRSANEFVAGHNRDVGGGVPREVMVDG